MNLKCFFGFHKFESLKLNYFELDGETFISDYAVCSRCNAELPNINRLDLPVDRNGMRLSKRDVIDYRDFDIRYEIVLSEIDRVNIDSNPSVILIEDKDSDLAMLRGLYWCAIWGEVLDSDLRRFTKTGEVLTMEQLKEKCAISSLSDAQELLNSKPVPTKDRVIQNPHTGEMIEVDDE